MTSSHCSRHVPGSTKLHSHCTVPCFLVGICAFALIVCSKSQVFPPKACNVHASFKSGIHLGLGRGGWWCWALLLLGQVQERHLGDAPFPRRWVWCKEHLSKGEMGFVESSEHWTQLCQNVNPPFPHLGEGAVKSCPSFCYPPLSRFAAACAGQQWVSGDCQCHSGCGDTGVCSCTGHTQSNGSLEQ